MKYHELIHRAQTGDALAQGELYESMYKRVYYLTLRITNSPEDAQDAAQDAFLSAFQALPKLKNPDAFESWLFQIAANKARGILRKNGRNVALAEDEDGRTMLDDLPDENEALLPEEVVDSADKRDIILSLIDGLPEAQRVCLVMFYYAELSVKQIAQELRCSENTVKSRLNYARQKIRQAVLDTEERDGIRLHAAAPLALLFAKDFEALSVDIPALAASAATAATGAEAAVEALAAAAETAAGTAAETGAVSSAVSAAAKTGILATAKAKIAAGVVAALLLAGGGAVVVSQTGDAPAEVPAPGTSQEQTEAPEDVVALEEDYDERMDAYRQIVQELVNEYGGPQAAVHLEDAEYDMYALDAVSMVNVVELIDLTDDGEDELVVFWQEPTGKTDAAGYGEIIAYSAAYTYENGAARQIWYSDHSSDEWNIFRQGDDLVIIDSDNYRGWADAVLVYQDGNLVDLMQGPEWTEEEHEWFLANGGTAGIVSEGDAIIKTYLRRVGVDVTLPWNEVALFSTFRSEGFPTSGMAQNRQEAADRCAANMEALGVRLPQPKVSSADILSKLAYYGDRSICKMDKQMAQAYANAIEGLAQSIDHVDYGSDPLYLSATLMDIANDGFPVLVTAYISSGEVEGGILDAVWTYQNGKAVRTLTMEGNAPSITDSRGVALNIVSLNGVNHIDFFQDFWSSASVPDHCFYRIENAQATLKHRYTLYQAYFDETGALDIMSQVPVDALQTYASPENASPESFAANGWEYSDDMQISGVDMSLCILDNSPVSSEETALQHLGVKIKKEIMHRWKFDLSTTPQTQAVSLLREYSKVVGRPVYSYHDVTTVLSADQMDQIAKLLAKELKGEIGEVYRLSDDLLYIVLYVDGEVSGCGTVKQTMKDGKPGFRLVSTTEEASPESDLQAQVQADQTQSNITLDYSDAGSNKSAYLTDALNNIDGAVVNDAAKGEIAAYVETAVSEASVTDVKCRKNAAVLTDKTIQESLTQAESEKAALDEALDGVELNKSLTIVLRVVCTNLTEGQPVQVTFEPSMLEAMADAQAVQVILGDGQHSVTISAEALTALCQTHGKITVHLQRNEDGAYTITLLDGEGQTIPKVSEGLTFTLPAESPNATVLASYEGGSDNWGGQYDSINEAIEFMTPYSGTYEVMENRVEINDLADCDEETAEAIRFMVSRGYFDLTDGNFDPDGTLNRYAFAQALVKMFFALDRSLTTSFTDVPADSEFYPYVASGEQDAIIEGFQDGTFRGEKDVLVEQVIALCSRTLADKKGYTYPETPADYLKFEDADEISDWALETTALAVREGLIEGTGVLGPQDPISRGDAAMMLYRLFMLLYEPPAAEITVVDTGSGGSALPIALGVAAVAAVGAGAVIWKKKKTPAEAPEPTPEPENGPEPENNEQEES